MPSSGKPQDRGADKIPDSWDDGSDSESEITEPESSQATFTQPKLEDSQALPILLATAQEQKTQLSPKAPDRPTTKVQTVSFLCIPGEIRERIYDLTLLERPKWEKPHLLTCAYHPVHQGHSGAPPFLLSSKQCRCAARRGISLLATCRIVHAEAAARFWAGNAHCFDSPEQLLRNIGDRRRLRTEYRALLQQLRVLSKYRRDQDFYIYHLSDIYANRALDEEVRLWKVLQTCSGLRMLEVYPSLAEGIPALIRTCASSLPELQNLRFLYVLENDLQARGKSWKLTTINVIDSRLGECPQSQKIHYEYGAEIDLPRLRSTEIDDEQVKAMVEAATVPWAHRSVTDSTVMGRCVYKNSWKHQLSWSYPFPLREDLDEVAREIEVHKMIRISRKAPKGKVTVTGRLYGLPISKATIERLRRTDEFLSGAWGDYSLSEPGMSKKKAK